MSVESLQQQIANAVGKLNVLQRRVDGYSPDPPKILRQTLQELATAIEELQVAQEQLIENRHVLEAMREELQRERDKYWQLFDSAPEAYLVTGPQSDILEANKAAAALLNISQRFLCGKLLSVFVCDERARFLAQASRLAQTGGSADWMLRLRPRERAPIDIAARVVANGTGTGNGNGNGGGGGDGMLRWMLRAVDGNARPFAAD